VGKKIDSEFPQSKKLDKTLKMKRLFIQLSLTNSESIFFLSLTVGEAQYSSGITGLAMWRGG
jgi:hypothetical protein